jgi:hypothetical protein
MTRVIILANRENLKQGMCDGAYLVSISCVDLQEI